MAVRDLVAVADEVEVLLGDIAAAGGVCVVVPLRVGGADTVDVAVLRGVALFELVDVGV